MTTSKCIYKIYESKKDDQGDVIAAGRGMKKFLTSTRTFNTPVPVFNGIS